MAAFMNMQFDSYLLSFIRTEAIVLFLFCIVFKTYSMNVGDIIHLFAEFKDSV